MKSNVTLTTLLIPAVQVGDTVAIEVDTYSGPFLTGTFALGR